MNTQKKLQRLFYKFFTDFRIKKYDYQGLDTFRRKENKVPNELTCIRSAGGWIRTAAFLVPRTGAPRRRPPVPEAAAESAAMPAVLAASPGSGRRSEFEAGQTATGDRTCISAPAELVRIGSCGECTVFLPKLSVLTVLVAGLVPVRRRVPGAVLAAVAARPRLLLCPAVKRARSGSGIITTFPFARVRFASRIGHPFDQV